MPILCQNKACSAHIYPNVRPSVRPIKHGFFYRKSDKKRIQKYKCPLCKKSFSSASLHPTYYQKKRYLNSSIKTLISSSVSQRRIAKILGVNPKTIYRALKVISQIALTNNDKILKEVSKLIPISQIQFDEMETFEHTKLKPLSIPLIVEKDYRFILSINSCIMPAKGLLVKKSKDKYGKRPNDRITSMKEGFSYIKELFPKVSLFESDQCSWYQNVVKTFYPNVLHKTYKGRRSCVVGQGELKAGGFDELFSINHTAASLRDNGKTLTRRTWCTVKKLENFKSLLRILQFQHNVSLITKLKKKNHILGSIKTAYNFAI